MQHVLLALVLLAAPAAGSAVSAQSAAAAWLKSHSPTDDQLGELKDANPDAYAMVKALLTKHSMGLVKLKDSEKGPDVFKRMMHEDSAPLSRAAMPSEHPVIENQMAYNPNAAAEKDESMVNNLLDAVAGLAGKKGKKLSLLRKRHHVEASPLAEDAAMFGLDENGALPTPAPERVHERAAVAPKKGNSYLEGFDLSGGMPVSLEQHKEEQKQATASENLLDSFSFDNAAAVAEAQLAAPKPKAAAPQAKKKNSFLNWLGMNNAPKEDAPKPASSYLQDFINA